MRLLRDLDTQPILSHTNVGSSTVDFIITTKNNGNNSKSPSLRFVKLFRHIGPFLTPYQYTNENYIATKSTYHLLSDLSD